MHSAAPPRPSGARCSPGTGQPVTKPATAHNDPHRFTVSTMIPSLEQLLRVPHVDDGYGFDLSPDGQRVAFSWNRSGAWEIYQMGLRPGASAERALTTPPGGKFRPRYSPDGARLAYALDLDGSESFHIAVLDLTTGQHRDLTPDIAFAHQPNMGWSPDGQMLAVL